jgi:hypothetical protein
MRNKGYQNNFTLEFQVSMAKSKNNLLTKGLSGMIGKQIVFRTWNGKTFISVAPKKPKKQSPIQKENRTKFKRATIFAKNMMNDPVKKAKYKEIAKKLQLPNAYTAAITDYMRNPEIEALNLSNYSGKADEEIKVTASKKDFEIQEVEVIIVDKNGEAIEEGKAKKGFATEWIYKTSNTIGETGGFLIRVRDSAGNIKEKRF